jgi:preprotein translocase subunit YajC
MTSMLAFALTLLAQAQDGQPAQPAKPPGGFLNDPWMMIGLMGSLLLFWFIVMNPNRRQQKEMKAMLASLQKGDEVVTSGGIVGSVYSIKEKAGGVAGQEDVISLRIDDKTRISVLRSSIVRVSRSSEAKDSKDESSGK